MISRMTKLGTVYLLHFDRPYRHARHYVGWTGNLGLRITRHRAGGGSPLIHAASEAGIGFRVARLWYNVTRRFERRVHHMQAKYLCPFCVGRGKERETHPRISDYQEPEAYEEYPENLEYEGHWEYQPIEEPWPESPRGPDEPDASL
jgi:hypothetical protein